MSFAEVLRRFRPQWNLLALLCGLAVIGAALDAVSVMAVVGIADSVSRGVGRFSNNFGPIHIYASISTLAIVTVVAVLGSVSCVLIGNLFRTRTVAAWATNHRLNLLEAFLGAQWSEQVKDRAGTLQANLGYITYAAAIINSLSNVARGFSGVSILIGSALLISPLAAVGILALGSCLYVVIRPLNTLVKRQAYEAAEQTKVLSQDFGDASELAREIRLFDAAGSFEKRTVPHVEALARAEYRAGILAGMVTPLYQGLALTIIVIALAMASRMESVDLAILGAVALLVLRSVSYGQQLQSSLNAVHQAAPALDVIDATIKEFRDVAPDYGDSSLGSVNEVVFSDGFFGYGEGDHALAGVNLSLHSGEIVGIVGPSGAGKSTLAQVLLRLYPLTSGSLVVNGESVGNWSVATWSKQVSLVPQQPFLMHGSVFDNIAFFREGIDREAVVSAAKAAGIHDTIEALDDGYDTIVGRSIRNLSGGQIQRLGIARALAARPSMIVLDEPTSALDQNSEAIVQATLDTLRGRALVVVIAHRLTTLSICDRVVVMHAGRIEADGPYEAVRLESEFFRNAMEQMAVASAAIPGDQLTAGLPTTPNHE